MNKPFWLLILLSIQLLLISGCQRLTKPAEQNPLVLQIEDDPILRQKALPVKTFSRENARLIRHMKAFLKKNRRGAIAAPQVGNLNRIFVIKWVNEQKQTVFYTFINPVITQRSTVTSIANERCLSFPGLTKAIKRPVSITVSARNDHFQHFKMEAHGLLARVIQHEADHLEGITIADK